MLVISTILIGCGSNFFLILILVSYLYMSIKHPITINYFRMFLLKTIIILLLFIAALLKL
jgi:hypothetical protein